MPMFFHSSKDVLFFAVCKFHLYFFVAQFIYNFSCEINPKHFFKFPCFCIVNSLMRFLFYVFRCIFCFIALCLLTWVFFSTLSCTPSSDFAVFSVLIWLLLELRYSIIDFMYLLFELLIVRFDHYFFSFLVTCFFSLLFPFFTGHAYRDHVRAIYSYYRPSIK